MLETDAPTPTRLNGAQARGTAWCWATRADGSICGARADASSSCLPYCAEHLKRGDEAMTVVTHPDFGDEVLVAARDLPKGYKTVYFGERKTWRECGRKGRDHAMHFRAGGGVIDPTPLGEAAQLQYMSNPGPNEVSNNRSTRMSSSAKRARRKGPSWDENSSSVERYREGCSYSNGTARIGSRRATSSAWTSDALSFRRNEKGARENRARRRDERRSERN